MDWKRGGWHVGWGVTQDIGNGMLLVNCLLRFSVGCNGREYWLPGEPCSERWICFLLVLVRRQPTTPSPSLVLCWGAAGGTAGQRDSGTSRQERPHALATRIAASNRLPRKIAAGWRTEDGGRSPGGDGVMTSGRASSPIKLASHHLPLLL